MAVNSVNVSPSEIIESVSIISCISPIFNDLLQLLERSNPPPFASTSATVSPSIARLAP